jgi:hypothetical protein
MALDHRAKPFRGEHFDLIATCIQMPAGDRLRKAAKSLMARMCACWAFSPMAADAHVLDHPLAQRRGPLLGENGGGKVVHGSGGITVAEIFLLLAFTLLMLMLLWRSEDEARLAVVEDFADMSAPERAGVVEVTRTFTEAGIALSNPAMHEKLEIFLDLEGSEAGQILLQ